MTNKGFILNQSIHVYPSKNELHFLKDNLPIERLEPRLMQLLVYMAQQPGEAHSRNALLTQIWGDSARLDEVLTLGISRLRKALRDDPRTPAFIQTLPRKGYRLIAEKSEIPVSEKTTSFSQPIPQSLYYYKFLPVIALASMLLLYFVRYSASSTDTSPLQMLPVTSEKGLEIQPAISNDGQFLLFSERKDQANHFDIYLKDLASNTTHNLTALLKGDCLSPVWSPSNDSFAFVHDFEGRTRIECMNIPTKKVTSLIECPVFSKPELDWSSDGQFLLFTERVMGSMFQKIWLFDFHKQEKWAITTTYAHSFQPIFSPNGKQLIFIKKTNRGIYQIIQKDLYRAHEQVLWQHKKRISEVCWKAPGKIIFTLDKGFLYELNIAEQKTQYLGMDRFDELTWSSQTETLFATRYQADNNIWHFNQQTGRVAPFLQSTKDEAQPTLSSNGQRLAFVSNQSGDNQLWAKNTVNGKLIQLTHFDSSGLFGGKSWAPDGNTLAFIRRANGKFALWLVHIPTLQLQLCFEDTYTNESPQWSADGKVIYYVSGPNRKLEFWKYTLTDGSRAQVVNITGEIAYGQMNATADTLYFTQIGQPGIWFKAVSNGSTALLHCDLDLKDYNNWQLLDHAIIFPERSPQAVQISRLSLLNGMVTPMYSIPIPNRALHTRLTTDASGDYLYFDQLDLLDTDIFALQLASK